VAKKYSMAMGLETAAFEAACRRVEKSLSAVEKAGKQAAAATTLGTPAGGAAGGGGGGSGTAGVSAAVKAAERQAAEIQRVQDKWFLRDYRARGEYEKRKIALTEASAARQAQAINSVSSAVTGLPLAVTGVGAALMGLEVGTRLVSGLASAFDDAKRAAREMANKTLDTLGDLKEIAAIKEKYAPTDEDLAQYLAIRKAGGLSHPVAVEYETQLLNSLGTVSKEKFSDAEREKYEIEGAKLVGRTVKPGDTATARAMAQYMGILPAYLPGKPTAAHAADVASDLYDVMGKGQFSQEVGSAQLAKLMGAFVSEKMPGQFRDPKMAAAFLAAASRFEKDAPASAAMEAFRELRTFMPKGGRKGMKREQAQLLEKMGVTEFDAPDAAMMKMFKYADENFKDEAFDAAITRRGFHNATGNRQLAAFYNMYKEGELQPILELGAKPTVPGTAEAKAAAAGRDKASRGTRSATDVDIAKIERGTRTTELEIAEREAKAALTTEGLYDTPLGNIAQRAASVASFGRTGAEVLLEQRALNEARQKAGIAPEAPPMEVGPGGDLGRFLFGLKALFESRFGDTAAQVNELKRIADSNEAMAKRDAERRAGGAPPPLGGGPAMRGGPAP
jgi:hypothetical protein